MNKIHVFGPTQIAAIIGKSKNVAHRELMFLSKTHPDLVVFNGNSVLATAEGLNLIKNISKNRKQGRDKSTR